MQTKNPWFMRHDFPYYKLPKALFTDPRYINLSSEAKIVYAFFLDRTSLSYKNGDKWLDAGGVPFIIFPQTEVARLLHCGHDKATKVLAELIRAKLVHRSRLRRGKTSRISVLPCMEVCEETAPVTAEKAQSSLPVSSSEPCGKTAGNKTEEFDDMSKTLYSKAAVQIRLEENISYNTLKDVYSVDTLNTIVSIMTELVCQKEPTVKIGGRVWNRQELADHILSLNDIHIEYVFDLLESNQTTPKSPRNYIKAVLCAVDNGTMEFYYASRVNRDLHQSG